MLQTQDFWMKPARKSLPDAPDREDEIEHPLALVALIHAEPGDEERAGKVVTKAIKNIKWVAGKFECKRVVLHFFAHLAKECAAPELARALVDRMAQRLEKAGYEVSVTPFGYFTEFRLHVDGASMAKVFVDI